MDKQLSSQTVSLAAGLQPCAQLTFSPLSLLHLLWFSVAKISRLLVTLLVIEEADAGQANRLRRRLSWPASQLLVLYEFNPIHRRLAHFCGHARAGLESLGVWRAPSLSVAYLPVGQPSGMNVCPSWLADQQAGLPLGWPVV